MPSERPLLAVGADLKNSITLVVGGQAFVSQHIGDLDHYQAFRAFEETIRDLVSMYEVRWDELLVVHDLHPQYVSTTHAGPAGRAKNRGAAPPCTPRVGAGGERRMGEARRGNQF